MSGLSAPPAGPQAPAPQTPGSMLFLCGLNVVRSPMAEIIARRVLPPTVFLASAGVKAGERDPFVDAVLAEIGLTLAARQPRAFGEFDDAYFDLIVTLAPEAHHRALELTRALAIEVEYWPTADPTTTRGTREQILCAYRDVRDRLAAKIRERFALAQ